MDQEPGQNIFTIMKINPDIYLFYTKLNDQWIAKHFSNKNSWKLFSLKKNEKRLDSQNMC